MAKYNTKYARNRTSSGKVMFHTLKKYNGSHQSDRTNSYWLDNQKQVFN